MPPITILLNEPTHTCTVRHVCVVQWVYLTRVSVAKAQTPNLVIQYKLYDLNTKKNITRNCMNLSSAFADDCVKYKEPRSA